MDQSDAQRSLLEIARRYNESLDSATLEHLADRGISRQVADGFLLGAVVDPAPGHEQYIGRLSVPYINPVGVRTMKFRALGDETPKYLCLPGAKPRIYNVMALLDPGPVVAICEGELDAVVCSAVVGVPAVGVPGVGSWLPHFPRLFAGVDRVLVVTDNDDKPDGHNPGRQLADRIARDLDQAVVIQPPLGEDLTTWVQRHGVDSVRERLQA